MADGQWLPSWNDSAVKSAILDFVARVTKQGGTDFVPPAGRIATFDNDGRRPRCRLIYLAQVRTRKSLGEMIRKLSVT